MVIVSYVPIDLRSSLGFIRMEKEPPRRPVCAKCGNDHWKRMLDERSQMMVEVCTRCRYYVVIEPVHWSSRPKDEITIHWDESIDNQEKLLEKDYERGLR